MKSKTSLFVIGFMIAMIAASLLTVLILFMTGAISTNPIELEFTVDAVEAKEYDGTPLRATSYAWNAGQLKEGHRIEARILGEQTDCGTSESDLLVKIFDADGRETTDEYSVKVNKGELTVTPKNVTVMLKAQQIPYSGKEIPIDNYDIFEGTGLAGNPNDFPKGSLAEGHKLVISFPGRFENVGDKIPNISEWSYENFKIYDESGRIVTYNYNMDMSFMGPGEIEIVPRRLKVKALDVEKYFDGKPVEGRYEIISGSLVDGHFIGEVEFESAAGGAVSVVRVEDSSYVKVSKITVYKQEGFNLVPLTEEENKNYVLEGGAEVFGMHTVLKRPVTVTAKDLVKTYDGAPLSSLLTGTEKPYTTDLPESFELKTTVDFSVTDVCDSVYFLDDLTITDSDGLNVTEQFDITSKSGIAKIMPIKIQSTLNQPDNVYYTGEEIEILVSDLTDGVFSQSVESYIEANEKLDADMARKLRALDGHTADFFDIACDKTIKNAGLYRFTLEFNENGIRQFGKAGNVVFEFSPTTLVVEKRTVNATYHGGVTDADGNEIENSISVIYNGTEAKLDCRNFTLSKADEAGEYDLTRFQISAADIGYADNQNHALVGNYAVTVNNVHMFDSTASEDVTQNFNVIPPANISVRITEKSAYLVVGQAYATYETDAEPTEDEGNTIAGELAQQFRSSVSIQGLVAGDSVGFDDFDISYFYDSSALTVTLTVSLGLVRNSNNENVLSCYVVENDGTARVTVQIVVKT